MPERTCSIPGCDRPVKAKSRGWCNRHDLRWRRHGDPLGGGPAGTAGQSLDQRLWSRVNKRGPAPSYRPALGPCWLWTGWVNNNGYGGIGSGGQEALVHRVAYELLVGPIPEGLEIDHLCRVAICVKAVADEHGPAHLEPVTHAENMRRRRGTHCREGHLLDEANIVHTTDGQRKCRICVRRRRRARTVRDRNARQQQRAGRAGS